MMGAENTKDYLLGQIKHLAEKSAGILAEGDSAGGVTAEQQTEVDGYLGRIEEHKVEVKRIEDREEMQARLEALGTVSDVAVTEESVPANDPGRAVIQSKAYQAVISEYKRTGQMPRFDNLVIEMKA